MPLSKRVIYDAQSYGHVELYEESAPKAVLGDVQMSTMLGALHQISYLSSYAFEIFDGLTMLADDVKDRVAHASLRADLLLTKLANIEKRVKDSELGLFGHSGNAAKTRYLSKREPFIPTVLSKTTNASAITMVYGHCNLPPQLWKIEAIVSDDCMVYYSNPGKKKKKNQEII